MNDPSGGLSPTGGEATAGARPGGRARAAGIALVAVSAASFGTVAIFARVAYEAGGDPVGVLFLRLAAAGGVLAALMAARGERWPRGRNLAGLLALGGLGYVGQSLAFFTGLTYASAGLMALLLYLFPAIVVVLSVVFLRERLSAVKVAALVLALLGSALTVGAAGGGHPLGVALGVLAALIYSLYVVVGSRVAPLAGAIPSSTVIILTAASVYGLLTAVTRPAFPTGASGAVAVLGLALIATVVALTTFFGGLARLGPSDTSTVSTIEPVVTVTLAAGLLGESLTAPQLAGGALIMTAVVVLARV